MIFISSRCWCSGCPTPDHCVFFSVGGGFSVPCCWGRAEVEQRARGMSSRPSPLDQLTGATIASNYHKLGNLKQQELAMLEAWEIGNPRSSCKWFWLFLEAFRKTLCHVSKLLVGVDILQQSLTGRYVNLCLHFQIFFPHVCLFQISLFLSYKTNPTLPW